MFKKKEGREGVKGVLNNVKKTARLVHQSFPYLVDSLAFLLSWRPSMMEKELAGST